MYIYFSNVIAGTQIGLLSASAPLPNGTICTSNASTPTQYTCTKTTSNGLEISTNGVHTVNNHVWANPSGGTNIAIINENNIQLGTNTSTNAVDDVALGNNSKTSTIIATTSSTVAGTTYNHAGSNPTSAIAVGDKDKERVIQSVAAGQISETSTDAVNGSQLYAAYDAINFIYQRQMVRHDSEINQINQNMKDLKEGAYAGIAGALAIGNLPQPTSPGKNMISGGMGTYKGHSAAAFGFSSVSENDKLIWKMGASFDNNRNSGGAISMGYQW